MSDILDRLRAAEARRKMYAANAAARMPTELVDHPELTGQRFFLFNSPIVKGVRLALGIPPRKLLAQSSPSLFWWR